MTDCARLLEVLSDHKPHSHHQLYGLGMVVHSRIADLRRKGYTIHAWQEQNRYANAHRPRTYWYRLARRTELRPVVSEESGSTGDRSSVGRVPLTVPPEQTRADEPALLSPPSLMTSASDCGADDEPETRPLFDLSNRPAWA